MNDTVTVALPVAYLGPILSAILGGVVGFVADRRRRCANCPEHQHHQDKIAAVEQRQAALEATLQQLCDRVSEVHDMMLQFLNR